VTYRALFVRRTPTGAEVIDSASDADPGRTVKAFRPPFAVLRAHIWAFWAWELQKRPGGTR